MKEAMGSSYSQHETSNELLVQPALLVAPLHLRLQESPKSLTVGLPPGAIPLSMSNLIDSETLWK
eukprot:CAMPEP_0173409858 /NCGR_PEP_ID=MMETSP1356-20130122/73199_1 /TAXON_ID=77927 ORGANISM="Hemiselmis virescens, Strain PCC157" /NCGR_SAMPLE_ID=MMETSP1356 /ASSEMBLY_ACC=CAM_ASM_000847 /LENGTH=64 /DNA_ID=CAMNT_0014371407 /DNA_START=90 /DNA_END=284 /DNA_ORIENTATION=-